MKEINASLITEKVRELCIECNVNLPEDVSSCLECALEKEPWEPAKEILGHIADNYKLASERKMPICQDTGMAVFYVEIGQEVHIEGNLEDAINQGVRKGYQEGFLRKSVVGDPLNRVNTGDNTPAVIHYEVVPGDSLTIHFSPKGAGSENMSRIAMLRPSDGVEGVKKFVLDTVEAAGPNPCPPIIVGVGIGGTFEKAALLSKKALFRPVDEPNGDEFYSKLEEELLNEINKLGIGPQGFGGKTTALGVNIETYPTHIAGLPVAVNISCHVTRHGKIVF